jgi:thiosulfate dehydrogenase (quinone) large subunit
MRFDDQALAYAILRLTIGMNFFCHGFSRIVSGVGVFVAGAAAGFGDTILPVWLFRSYLTMIPFIEVTLGVLLILGLFSRAALVAGGLFIVSLTFGQGMRSNWETLGLHLSYAVVYFILLFLRDRHNAVSIDSYLGRRVA